MKKKFKLVVLLLFVLACSAFAQSNLLIFSPGATAMGIGRSGVVGIYDPSSLYWNPAALGSIHSSYALASIHDPFTINYAGYAHFLPDRGAIALHVGQTDNTPYGVQFAGFGIGHMLARHFYAGVSLNGMQIGKEGWTTVGVGLLFRPTYSPFDSNSFSSSPLIADKLAIGLSVTHIPLVVTDYDHQTRIGISYDLPSIMPTIYYAHHFQRGLNTAHMGIALAISPFVKIFGGLEDFDSQYWAFGAELNIDNFALSLTYDKIQKRAVFTASIRISSSPSLLAEKEYQKAKSLLQLKDRRGAYRAIQTSLSHEPQYKKSVDLGKSLKPVIDVLNSTVDSLMQNAHYWEERKKYVNAAANYLKILRIDPRNTDVETAIARIRPKVNYQTSVWFKTGEQLYNDGNLARAKEVFESILLILPSHSGALTYISKIDDIYKKEADERYFRALGYYSQRNLVKAREEFEAVLKVIPNHPDAQNYLDKIDQETTQNKERIYSLLIEADNFLSNGSLLNAKQRYSQILALDPAHLEAKEKLSAVNARITENIQVQYNNGQQALNDKRYSDARRYFRAVLQLEPAHNGARRYLGMISNMSNGSSTEALQRAQNLYDQQNWAGTISVLDSILANSSNSAAKNLREQAILQIDISAMLEQAKSQYLSGEYIAAINAFDVILKKDPQNKEAQELLSMCKSNLSEQVDEIFNRGIRLYTYEKYNLAIQEFDNILKVNPTHKGALEYKTKAQERLKALEGLK